MGETARQRARGVAQTVEVEEGIEGEAAEVVRCLRMLVEILCLDCHNAPTRVIISSSGMSRYQSICSKISSGSVEIAEILPAASRAAIASAVIAMDVRNVLLSSEVSVRKQSGEDDRYRLENNETDSGIVTRPDAMTL